MDPDTDQPVTLNDAAESAFAELETKATDTPAVTDGAAPLPDEPKAFELPSYAKAWPETARNALLALGNAKHNRSHLDPILSQHEELNRYIERKNQEHATYRRDVDPIYETLKQLEPQYRLQGMDLRTGVAQMAEGFKFVAADPDQAFPYFAGRFTPRDPASAVMGIAKAWGVDLGQVTQEQPWVDPSVQALLSPLQQQLAEVRQFTEQQRQAQEQQAYAARQRDQEAIVAKLESLEQQKDESGNLRFPHLATVFDDIVVLANTGRFKTIEDAYDRAVLMNPELAQGVIADRAKAAEQKAIQEAAARTSAAQQEASANRSIAGNGRRVEGSAKLSLQDAAERAYAQTYGT
jgi:hypothetical protein